MADEQRRRQARPADVPGSGNNSISRRPSDVDVLPTEFLARLGHSKGNEWALQRGRAATHRQGGNNLSGTGAPTTSL